MTLAQLGALVRLYTPGTKATTRLTPEQLTSVINAGARDIALYTACLKKDTTFSVVDGQSEYFLSTVASDYLMPDKPGLWWSDGTNWHRLNPRTLAWLDKNRPNWRNLAEGDPQDYTIDNNTITIVPTPDTSLTNGFWLYYVADSVNMTDDAHYPFSGSIVEYPHLVIFDEAICRYACWKIDPMLNKDQTYDIREQEYKREREEKFALYKRRRDIGVDAKFQSPRVRA